VENLRNLVDQILVPHTAFMRATAKVEQCIKSVDGKNEPICLALIGESRTGKSRVQEYIEAAYPIVRLDDGLSVPVFRVSTPSMPTVMGLVEIMLEAMGDPKFDKGTERVKTIRLRKLLRNARTKMVVLDEFQHFYDKGSHKIWHYVADWLKILVDQAKVALLVGGLPSCKTVIDQNEQLTGRFLAPVMMPRFDWRNDNSRGEFISILSAFQEVLAKHFDIPCLDEEEMSFRCYCATGGLIGYLAKFLRQAVWNAIDAGSPVISLEDLAQAHGEAVWAQERTSDMPSPFDRSFAVTPTEELLAQVRRIGESALEPERHRRIRPRNAPSPSISEVLSAS